jgi:hemolysin activation/secretion protein
LGIDNRLPPSLGNWELNGALAVNSPLGYGEQVYGAASVGADLGKVFDATTPMQLLGVGAVLPIGLDGLKFNPEYTNSVTRPAPFPRALADVGYFQRFDLRASYPLILSRAQALTFQATYEWAQEHLSPIGFDTDIYDTSTMSPGFSSRITSGCPWACSQGPSSSPRASAVAAKRKRF